MSNRERKYENNILRVLVALYRLDIFKYVKFYNWIYQMLTRGVSDVGFPIFADMDADFAF